MLELEKLKNKYIKYSEEITEDTFNKILDRAKEFAKEICPDLKTYRSFDDHSFDSFRLNEFFRFSGSSCSYGVDNNRQDAEEIKVSDILGEETQFEVGKWYRNLGTDKKYIAKLSKIKGNKFWQNEYIFEGRYQKTSGYLVFEDDIEKVTDLSEIQQYLPDNHPDKIVKPIEKWSVGSYVVFCKNSTNKNVLLNKPYEIIKKRLNSTYIGIIDEAGNLSTTDYTSTFYIIKWLATLSEAEAFSKSLWGPKKEDLNKYDPESNLIKMKKYVKCDTQEQWNFVLSKFNPSGLHERMFNTYKSIGIDLMDGCYTDTNWYDENGYKKVTFQEWLNLNDYTFEEGSKEKFKIGDYVVSLIDTPYGRKKGDLLLITEEDSYRIVTTKRKEFFNGTITNGEVTERLRKATAAEIMAVTKPEDKPFEYNKWYKRIEPECSKILIFVYDDGYYGFDLDGKWFNSSHFDYSESGKERLMPATTKEVKERLLNFAKEKYPVGTKFKELNAPYSLKEFNEAEFDYYPEQDQLTCGQSIYIRGKWAEVISKPESKVNRNVYYEVKTQKQYNKI